MSANEMMKQTNRFGLPGFAALLKNTRGNVAVIFGLTALPLILTTGVALDFARLTSNRKNLQQATDSAALMVATKITATTTDLDAQRLAQVYVQRNYPPALVSSAAISSDRLSVRIVATAQIATTVMRLANVNVMTASATSQASLAGGTDPNSTYEIALVLDNSGSMAESAGGVSKIRSLQSAATSFVNTMFSKVSSGKLQISIAPFASGVVAADPSAAANRTASWVDTQGLSSQHWIAFGGKTAANAAGFTNRFDIFAKLKAKKSSWDWGGCFEEQPYPWSVNDTAPNASNPDTLFVPFLAPDEPSGNRYADSYVADGGGSCSTPADAWADLTNVCKYNIDNTQNQTGAGPNAYCPSASTETLLPLASTQSTIINKLNQLVANGNTNLHQGFMWGWRTLSPNPPFAMGKAYNSANNRKIMIFMTDGYNAWASRTQTVTGSTYQMLGYYSYNGTKNIRFSDGGKGDGVNYQTKLTAAANSGADYSATARNALDDLTLEACTNAKAQGIEIFTIGFSVPIDPIDQQGLTLLQSCATNSDHYYTAANASDLNAVFASIGMGLGKLRLSL
jgi:Flp pilus assembly protein TadG